eukprot:7379957-Prymnesium_polylepis.1
MLVAARALVGSLCTLFGSSALLRALSLSAALIAVCCRDATLGCCRILLSFSNPTTPPVNGKCHPHMASGVLSIRVRATVRHHRPDLARQPDAD